MKDDSRRRGHTGCCKDAGRIDTADAGRSSCCEQRLGNRRRAAGLGQMSNRGSAARGAPRPWCAPLASAGQPSANSMTSTRGEQRRLHPLSAAGRAPFRGELRPRVEPVVRSMKSAADSRRLKSRSGSEAGATAPGRAQRPRRGSKRSPDRAPCGLAGVDASGRPRPLARGGAAEDGERCARTCARTPGTKASRPAGATPPDSGLGKHAGSPVRRAPLNPAGPPANCEPTASAVAERLVGEGVMGAPSCPKPRQRMGQRSPGYLRCREMGDEVGFPRAAAGGVGLLERGGP